jgi:hypothetical protein
MLYIKQLIGNLGMLRIKNPDFYFHCNDRQKNKAGTRILYKILYYPIKSFWPDSSFIFNEILYYYNEKRKNHSKNDPNIKDRGNTITLMIPKSLEKPNMKFSNNINNMTKSSPNLFNNIQKKNCNPNESSHFNNNRNNSPI